MHFDVFILCTLILHYLIAHMIDACMHSDNTIVGSAYTNLYLLIGLCLFCVLLISAACI